MSPWARGRHANKSKHWWWPPLFFSSLLLLPSWTFFLHLYKANRVWTPDGTSVNTGCCDVCVVSERLCVWWTFLTPCLWWDFFLTGWDVLCSQVLCPRLTCWALTTKQMASIAARSDLWPRGFELPRREELFETPSWFNNIFSPGAAKELSCLTPGTPSPWAATPLFLSSTRPHTMSSCLTQSAVRTPEHNSNLLGFRETERSYVIGTFVIHANESQIKHTQDIGM